MMARSRFRSVSAENGRSRRAVIASLGATLWLALVGAATSGSVGRAAAEPNTASEKLAGLPLEFIENRGQYSGVARFYVQGRDKLVGFAKDGITFSFANAPAPSAEPAHGSSLGTSGSAAGWTVKLEFAGARPGVVPQSLERSSAKHSFFRGTRAHWRSGVPSYRKVAYRELWPGIDLVFGGSAQQLKYEFLVRPGADPSLIRLRYRGATDVKLTPAGDLEVATPVGGFTDEKPYLYQQQGAERTEVTGSFRLTPAPEAQDSADGERLTEVGFSVGSYDPTRTLVIDPAVLIYCGYIGGNQMTTAAASPWTAPGTHMLPAPRSPPSLHSRTS